MSMNKNSQKTSYQSSVFLTVGIQTYNRAIKLNRLLNQFCELSNFLDIKRWDIEILLSDNCSTDHTPLVIEKAIPQLTNSGYYVSSFRQEVNLGLDGNSLFIFTHAQGKYLWFFSDDDILIPENTQSLLEDLTKFQPGVCLSNFIQPPYTSKKTIFLTKEKQNQKIIYNPVDCIKAIKKYAKLTNYIVKKELFIADKFIVDYNELLEKCSGQFYLFISLSLVCYFAYGNILVRQSSIAKCDSDYLNIEYSPKVFENLNSTIISTLTFLKQDEYIKQTTRPQKPVNRVRASIKFLLLHYEGKIHLPQDILEEEERYLSTARYYYFLHPLCVVNFLKLIFIRKIKVSSQNNTYL